MFAKYNSQFDLSHIKDSYFKEKLVKGIVKYEPELWAIAQLEGLEEKTLG